MKRLILGIIKFIYITVIIMVIILIIILNNKKTEIINELDLNENTFNTTYGHTFNYTYKQKSFFLAVYEQAQLYYKNKNKWVLVDTMNDVEPELQEVYRNEKYIVYCEINKTHYYVVFFDSNKIVNLTDEILDVLSKGEKAVFDNKILSQTKAFILNYMPKSEMPSLNRRYLVIKEYLK